MTGVVTPEFDEKMATSASDTETNTHSIVTTSDEDNIVTVREPHDGGREERAHARG